ncbi:MAG: hypothetical protein JNL07_09790, partial [Rhodospirillales bacterium]|nr:hypothetical protein [Rhodospirillales bacterium]
VKEGAKLVVGPGNAKTGFVAHVEAHHRDKRPLIAAVETVDHPTDGELLKIARARAEAIDRMRPRGA